MSWYQPAATVSVELIRRLAISKTSALVDIGGGASPLVDGLVTEGFEDLSVLDVSEVALETVRQRLGRQSSVKLIHADILTWVPERAFDVWHDRAVFHFLADEQSQVRYLATLRKALRPGGVAIFGTFAADGPEYCSGLPVARYAPEELARKLGDDIQILEQLREEHVTPTGVMQPFTWLAARVP